MADFDRNKPSIAHVYDYFLGGMDNFPADRVVADQLIAAFPRYRPRRGRTRRCSPGHAMAAEQERSQFIDLG